MDKPQPIFTEEYQQVIKLARRYAANAEDKVLRLKHLLAAFLTTDMELWLELLGVEQLTRPEGLKFEPGPSKHGKYVFFSSQVARILSLHGGRLGEAFRALGGGSRIGLTELAGAMLINPRGPVLELLQLNATAVGHASHADLVTERLRLRAAADRACDSEAARGTRMRALQKIRKELRRGCHGQDQAIDTIVAQIATAANLSPAERDNRPLSFAFIGGTGTGKSLLATSLRDLWAKAFGTERAPVLDMSRFAIDSLSPDFIGRDASWKDGGKTGALTSLAANNPQGVIILDNIDKAHPAALVHVATMLTDGVLKDGYSGEDVSFADNIVIMTTSQGTSFLGSGKFAAICARNGGTIPGDKLIEGVVASMERGSVKDRAGIIGEILAKASCSIVFKRHCVNSLHAIVGDAVDSTLRQLGNAFHAQVSADREALIAFFLESRQNLDSAHGISQAVNTVMMSKLEEAMLVSASCTDFTCPKITFAVDALPPLDAAANEDGDDPLAGFRRRTVSRLRQAKRLDYDIDVDIGDTETIVRLTHLRHTVMPSVEDASWFSVTPPDVDPSDLVGLETAWAKAKKFVSYLDHPDPGAAKPNHMLLYGPPGTGKTAFAKAVARTLSRSIICVNASKFASSVVDTHAIAELQELFDTAERTGSIVFLDECDAIGSRDHAMPTQAAVINTLLTLLDGFEENHVLVIGATNRPKMIDSALTRPGRLHTRIKIDVLRKREDRERLLDVFCRKHRRTLAAGLREFIVQATDSWAPANILSVLREMCELAGSEPLTRVHFAKARTSEFVGEESQRAPLTPAEKRQIATHEAGHALTASLYGQKWVQVTIVGFGSNLGFLERLREGSIGRTERQLREDIDIALAGNAAERLAGTVSEGSESDFTHATEIARRLLAGGFAEDDELAVTPDSAEGEHDWERLRPQVNAILRERMNLTRDLLAKHRQELVAIADELVRKDTLFADEVASIISPKNAAVSQQKENTP